MHIDIMVKIKYGSHLYGTATARSDVDIKGIYIPNAHDILLQKISPVISLSKAKTFGEGTTASTVDFELYSPAKYLSLLAQGQSVALELLFAPESALLSTPDKAWLEIKTIAPKILTKRAMSFVHYCKQQAHKYCIKGAKLAAARHALDILNQSEVQYGPSAKLSTIEPELQKLAANNEFISVDHTTLAQGHKETYVNLCGKKALFSASIKSARLIAQNLIDEYGHRAFQAEQNKGIDWKALMHAVRVGHQALEFLNHHHITFPRPEAAHLLDIRQGKIAYKQATEEIEQLLANIELAARNSTLPESFDQQIIDDFIEQLYREQVCKK